LTRTAGNDPDWFAQLPYRYRLEWGRRGARAAAARGDVLVVVDVLSFSTAAATAVERGAIVYPCAKGEDTPEFAARVRAERAVSRYDVPARGRFSLSPPTLLAAAPGDRIVLASPNGATCARYGAAVPALFVGALVNAAAVAGAVARTLDAQPPLAVTVLVCGERWDMSDPDDGDLRFALEDLLGAGAVLAHLPPDLTRSPEARAAEATFHAAAHDLPGALRACGSGVELIAKGFPEDVEHAARLSVFDSVPVLRGGERLEPL
jgi:2-phosphosulfolactate phosphatase